MWLTSPLSNVVAICLRPPPPIHYSHFKRKEKTDYKDFKHASRKSKSPRRGKEIKLASVFSTAILHVRRQWSKPLSSFETKYDPKTLKLVFQELIWSSGPHTALNMKAHRESDTQKSFSCEHFLHLPVLMLHPVTWQHSFLCNSQGWRLSSSHMPYTCALLGRSVPWWSQCHFFSFYCHTS